jgi:DNA-binding MarR family transcriptional regulator
VSGALAAAPPYSAEVVPLHGQPGPDSLLGHWLALVSKNRHLQLERAARKLRITTTEWIALRQLQRSGCTTQCRLANDAGLTAPSLSRALSSLEDLGYVNRNADIDDMRFVRVEITDAGRALVPLLLETERKVDRELFGCLAQAAREELTVALRSVATVQGIDGAKVVRRGR